jgi:hypothetical protein
MLRRTSCGSSRITEERNIQMPREALTPRMKLLLWPFRMSGGAIITFIVTLLVVGLMFPIPHAQAIR